MRNTAVDGRLKVLTEVMQGIRVLDLMHPRLLYHYYYCYYYYYHYYYPRLFIASHLCLTCVSVSHCLPLCLGRRSSSL